MIYIYTGENRESESAHEQKRCQDLCHILVRGTSSTYNSRVHVKWQKKTNKKQAFRH